MNLKSLIPAFMRSDTPAEEVESTEDRFEELAKELSTSLVSMPRSLAFGATTQRAFTVISRDEEYIKRHTIYRDSFTREMVKIIIGRAIGFEHNDTVPFEIIPASDDLNGNAREFIKEELKYVRDLALKDILPVAMDSQFYGDAYTSLKVEEGVGVTKLVNNFSTKPFNVTPYVTNSGDNIAFEVSPNEGMFSRKTIAKENISGSTGRRYVHANKVARLNAQSNGILDLQSTTLMQLDAMNAFDEEERVYEDLVYGGVIEGCWESFERFQWAINSLANMRISSSIIERFVTQNLQYASERERKLLKEALEKKIESTRNKLKEKVETKDPTANIITHIIPTVGDGTNEVQVQESNISFNQQIQDIEFHLKTYLADIGFNIDLTPFASSELGGGERDGSTQSSIQMEIQGEQIRGSITEYLKHIVKVHFLAKFHIELDTEKIKVQYTATLNKGRVDAETQRAEAVNNTQQMSSLLTELKGGMYEDTPEARHMLTQMLKDIISNTAEDKEQMLEAMLTYIFTKPKNPEEGAEL